MADPQIEVDIEAVRDASGDWRERASELVTAADRLSGIETVGFTEGARGAFSDWLDEWGATIRAVADKAVEVQEALSWVDHEYTTTDLALVEEFREWLGAGL